MISIIIPVYNTRAYIERCIRSVINQVYREWECILIDDGSIDDSGSICDNWATRDTRVKVIHQVNQGVSVARNNGLSLSKGEYIVFVDSDDWIEPTYLSELITHQNGADLVVSGVVGEYSDGHKEMDVPLENGSFEMKPENSLILADLNEKSLLYGPVNKLYKSTIIHEEKIFFPEKCAYGEDLIFNFRYLEFVKTISLVQAPTYHYMHAASVLTTKVRFDQFDNDYTLWVIRRDFFVRRDLFTKEVQRVMYSYLWGQVYNGLFLFLKIPHCDYKYLRKILSIPEIIYLKNHKEVFVCPLWIKYSILYRMTCVFYLYFRIQRWISRN